MQRYRTGHGITVSGLVSGLLTGWIEGTITLSPYEKLMNLLNRVYCTGRDNSNAGHTDITGNIDTGTDQVEGEHDNHAGSIHIGNTDNDYWKSFFSKVCRIKKQVHG